MRLVEGFRRPDLGQKLVSRIWKNSRTPIRLMEFCGGHTVAILRFGIRQLMPPTVDMVSGPGCPVCVTDNQDIDKAIALARTPGLILATFGDMMKVPGSRSSLAQVKAEGADVRIVYSTLDALQIARDNPSRPVVFLGIGFETTAPTVAASVLQAEAEGIHNYWVLGCNKLTPPVVKAILDSGEVKLDGIVCPGHVGTVTGSRAWEFIAKDYGISAVVTGFEPVDILLAVAMLVERREQGKATVEIAYTRSVRPEGNVKALELMDSVFQPSPARWRGIGPIPRSGLALNSRFRRRDADLVFRPDPGPTVEPKGCICGAILRGVKTPLDCGLFSRVCTPEKPVGPCMVSAEGACSAYYLYGEGHEAG